MSISSEEYRDALRHFPAGVTIVTLKARGEDVPHGLTVSAFVSVSPVPPLIMVVIDHKAESNSLLQQDGTVFAVNILSQEKEALSNRFAWVDDADRFAEGEWETAVTGAPILKDSIAWLDCTVYARYEAGTHTIYIGQVQASGVPCPDAAPLIYWNRDYRRLDLGE